MQQLAHIFHLIEKKYDYSLEKDPTRATHVPYLTSLQHELKHVEELIVANNSVHLEAKLWSLLWDYCNMLHTLQKEGYIDSVHNVMERTLETYEERVDGIKEGTEREDTKWVQKERLFQEQVLKNS